MARGSFVKGQLVEIDGQVYRCVGMLGVTAWQLQHVETGAFERFECDQLYALVAEGRLTFRGFPGQDYKTIHERPLQERLDRCGEKAREQAMEKYAYVKNVLASGEPIGKNLEPRIRSVWETLRESRNTPPNWVTVARWIRRYVDGGQDICTLLPRDHLKGRRKQECHPMVAEIIDRVVEDFYLTRERPTLEQTLDAAKSLVLEENCKLPPSARLAYPTRGMICANIDARPAYDVSVARDGYERARVKFRSVQKHVTADYPMQRVEIDHTQLDIYVIDGTTGLPRGRPWLTAAIDTKTRCILGFHVEFSPPSYLSVARCLKRVVLPKTAVREEFPSVVGDWPCCGLPTVLVVDNGLEFHGFNLEHACYQLGIEVVYAKRKTGWHKGKIERWFRTMHGATSKGTPGTTFGNILDKQDYCAISNAVVDLETLWEGLTMWIVDVYHQQKHFALNKRPIKMWQESAKEFIPQFPVNTQDIDASLGHRKTRKLDHRGVVLQCLWFNSHAARDLRKRLGSTLDVEMIYDPENLSSVYIRELSTGETVKAYPLLEEYATGLSLWQHERCWDMATEDDISASEEERLIMAKEKLRTLFQKGLRHRKSSKRFKKSRGARPTPAARQATVRANPDGCPDPTVHPAQPTPVPPAAHRNDGPGGPNNAPFNDEADEESFEDYAAVQDPRWKSDSGSNDDRGLKP